MSEKPAGWVSPKIDWTSLDAPTSIDPNRIETNIEEIEDGNRTLVPGEVPTGNTGVLGRILSWFTNRIHVIVGGTNWWDAPDTSLYQAKQHIDSVTDIHGADSDASTNKLVKRDSSSRFRVATPSDAQDVANKQYNDDHAAVTSPHEATSTATVDRLVLRDASSRARVVSPVHSTDISNKLIVDNVQNDLDAKMHETTGHDHSGTTGESSVIQPLFAVGSLLLNSNPPYNTTISGSWTKLKETRIGAGGTLRVSYYAAGGHSGHPPNYYYNVRRNGVVVGTELVRTPGSSAVTRVEDIAGWSPGDLVQIWARLEYLYTDGFGNTTQIGVSNLNLYTHSYGGARIIL